MLDDVAGRVLVVLMYSGAFHDLLKGLWGIGRVFNHNAEPLLIKAKCQNRRLGDMVSGDIHFKTVKRGYVGFLGVSEIFRLVSPTHTCNALMFSYILIKSVSTLR